jgi:hypothetical protein
MDAQHPNERITVDYDLKDQAERMAKARPSGLGDAVRHIVITPRQESDDFVAEIWLDEQDMRDGYAATGSGSGDTIPEALVPALADFIANLD